MIPITLGAILGAITGGWLIVSLERREKDRKKRKAEWTYRDVASWMSWICVYAVMFSAIFGAIGWGVARILPAPPRQTEERVIVETLLPFAKNTEAGPTIYAILGIDGRPVRVRYNDGTSVKIGSCCDEKAPKIVETKDNPSIKRYHRPGYRGWFSLRLDKTWYEIYVPRKFLVPMNEVPTESLR